MARQRPTRDLVSIQVAVQELGVADRTLRRYIAEGRLTGYRVGARLLRVDRNEFAELIKVVPTAGGRPVA